MHIFELGRSVDTDPARTKTKFVTLKSSPMYNALQHITTKMKQYLLLILMLFAFNFSYSQLSNTISGTINYRDTTIGLANISVVLSGDTSLVTLTDGSGFYEFSDIDPGNYTVTPQNNSVTYCGLSTLDIVVINRHINGIQLFVSPYERIAADINNDNSIDAFDLIDLENLLLFQTSEFPNNTSWRFVDADFPFPTPDPFSEPWNSSISFTTDQFGQFNVNFIGIKVGDLAGSGNPCWPEADVCNIDCAKISGQIAFDENSNCLIDTLELALDGWFIQAISATDTFTTSTGMNGSYSFNLPADTYTLTATPQNTLWDFCTNDVSLTLSPGDNLFQHFEAQAVNNCHLLSVDISNGFLRRCFPSYYAVQYCNEGTIPALDAVVEVTLDSLTTLTSSSTPASSQNGNTYTFDVGDVDVGECQTIHLTVDVSCDAELEQTLCATASITPETDCSGPALWDGANLELTASCDDNDEVIFTITNTGAPMTEALDYVIIEDDMIMMMDPNGNPLGTLESHEIPVPANGATWRMEAYQTDNHPFSQKISTAIERCGEDANGSVSLGFINQFPLLSSGPGMSVDCSEVRGAFDPNDKAAAPIGAHDEHYIEVNTDLEYKIRFQNTGTDTAFTVEIRDEISRHLDLVTLTPLAASHDYRFSIEDNNVAVFSFPNIMLPDSFVNEAASHGFITFQIAQKEDNPIGTVIENEAGIYFDFNDPVITNVVNHTVGEDFLEIINSVIVNPGLDFQLHVAPNPMIDYAKISITGIDLKEGLLSLYNLQGQMIHQYSFDGNQVEFNRKDLSAGMYFFDIREAGEKISTGKLMVR